MPRYAACLAAWLALLWLAACASRYPYTIAPGQKGAPGVQTVVLLPLNLVVALPPELGPPVERVSEQIEAYLGRRGKTVIAPGVYDSRLAWNDAVSRAKTVASEESFDAAMRILVERLQETQRFDALVMPSLVYRDARMQAWSHIAIWDGVKRELHATGEENRDGDVQLMNSFYGKISAVSLHVLVYDAQGGRVFERFGGLDLAHEADVSALYQQKPEGWLRLKDEVLGDTAAVREGIRIAFYPYLPISAQTSSKTASAP